VTLLIDNYDSFTYNLYQMIGGIDPNVNVARNDKITVTDIRAMRPDRLVFSPGPGRPEDAGVMEDAVRGLAGGVPMLGVCLGHQAICEVYGGEIVYAKTLIHGKPSNVMIDNQCPVFEGLPDIIQAARYHSLAAKDGSFRDLTVCARAEDGEVMAVSLERAALYGVQFHPESILSPLGVEILRNF
jgi:anthranilate synthase component 2